MTNQVDDRDVRMLKFYRCLGCGKEFSVFGIGPHQKGTGHNGRVDVGDKDAGPVTEEAINARQNRTKLAVAKRKARQFAQPKKTAALEWVSPDDVRDYTAPDAPIPKRPITRVTNMEVVTDGERIGIVEWVEK